MLVTDSKGIMIYGLISAIFHELGHLLCMRFFGYKVRVINFGLLNADMVSDEFEVGQSFLILFSGCFVNLLLAILFGCLFVIYNNPLFKIIVWQNIGLGIFNFLPILNLDGGQIFYIFLKMMFNESVALKIMNLVSFVFLIPILTFGFYLLINSKYNFSLFLLSLYLISYIIFKEDVF